MSGWSTADFAPLCYCGKPTVISVSADGRAELICIAHAYSAGAYFPLPRIKPDNWDTLSRAELVKVMEQAYEEEVNDE